LYPLLLLIETLILTTTHKQEYLCVSLEHRWWRAILAHHWSKTVRIGMERIKKNKSFNLSESSCPQMAQFNVKRDFLNLFLSWEKLRVQWAINFLTYVQHWPRSPLLCPLPRTLGRSTQWNSLQAGRAEIKKMLIAMRPQNSMAGPGLY
jgi:hypothetical protein